MSKTPTQLILELSIFRCVCIISFCRCFANYEKMHIIQSLKCMMDFSNSLILICIFLECEDGLYGINCLYRCYCNGASCDRMMGKCNCSAGWTGMACEKGTLIVIMRFK